MQFQIETSETFRLNWSFLFFLYWKWSSRSWKGRTAKNYALDDDDDATAQCTPLVRYPVWLLFVSLHRSRCWDNVAANGPTAIFFFFFFFASFCKFFYFFIIGYVSLSLSDLNILPSYYLNTTKLLLIYCDLTTT